MREHTKKILEKIVILIIILSLLAYSSISIATTSSDLNDLKDEQSSVSQQIEEKQQDLEEITSEKSETLEQVETLISQISDYQSEIDDLQGQISDLKGKISEAEEQIAADEKEYQEKRDLLDTRIVATYKNGTTSYLDYLLSSSSLMEFISNYYLVSQVVDYDQRLLDEVNAHKEKIEAEKAELETSQEELEKSETTLKSKQQALQVAKKEKEAYVEQLSDEEKEAQEQIQQLQDANDELDRKIEAAKAEIEAAKKAAEAAKNNSSSSSSSSAPSGSASSYGLIWPVLSKYRVTTGWYYSTGALHGASDFSGAGIYGTPVYAAADGYVVNSDWGINGYYNGYGNCVFIAHYNGLYTLYAHMSSRVVSEGEKVTQGQVIGYVGSTGNSTGPHLHFEVRTGSGSYSERVNPIYYLP